MERSSELLGAHCSAADVRRGRTAAATKIHKNVRWCDVLSARIGDMLKQEGRGSWRGSKSIGVESDWETFLGIVAAPKFDLIY